MRKFLIRWWYTPNWPREQNERMIRHLNGDWFTPNTGAVNFLPDIGPDPYRHLWHLIDEAFHAECEVVARRFREELLRITDIDMESKTVTFGSEPVGFPRNGPPSE